MFFTAASDPDWTIFAHNNPFDSAIEIYQAAPRFGWPLVPIERQVCTMALAQYHNYPGALEKIADRLKLPLRKDKEGKKLMRRLTRPQRRPDGTWGYIEPTPEEWERFIEYCEIDAGLVREVRRHFKPLPEIEQRLYPLDHKINHHGPTIDVALATQGCELVKVERATINVRLCEITDGRGDRVHQGQGHCRVRQCAWPQHGDARQACGGGRARRQSRPGGAGSAGAAAGRRQFRGGEV